MKPIRKVLALIIALAAASRGHAQANTVVLLPGLDETNSAVAFWGQVLVNTGFYSARTVPSLNSSSSIATQTGVVNGYLSAQGLGPAAVIIGHSQGGLVARYASRSTALQGLVTVVSPNAGAPIATAGAISYAAGIQAGMALELFQVNYGWTADWSVCPDCSQDWTLVSAFITDAATLVGTGFEIYAGVPFLTSNPHLSDMGPGTPVITSLVSNYGLELANDREAVAADVQDYASAPFRMIPNQTPDDADAEALALSLWASDLIFDGMDLYNNANDPGECDGDACSTLSVIGNSMVTLGDLYSSIAVDFNFGLIGGIPNDGLVPTANEALPDKVVWTTVALLNHNEVLGDDADIVGAVNKAAGR